MVVAGGHVAEMKNVGVVGGGQMGSGIAQLAAVNGLLVWLHDSDSTVLTKAHQSISSRIQRLISKGHLTEEKGAEALRNLRCTATLEDFRSVDIVIEAIVESEEVKKKLFAQLDKIVKSSAILASDEIYFNCSFSVPIGPARFGKKIICSQDFSGFVVNRVLMPMINEAFHALYTGVATTEDIDAGMKLGTNIGLDVCLSIMKVLHAGLGDSKYAPCPLHVQYVDAGRVGKKKGIGVYKYTNVSKGINPSARL